VGKKRESEATGEPKEKRTKIEVLTNNLLPGWKSITAKEGEDIISPPDPKATTHTSEEDRLGNWMSKFSTNQVASTDTDRALGKSKPSGITQAEQLLGESPPYSPPSFKIHSSPSSTGEEAVNDKNGEETNHQGASPPKQLVTQVWVRQWLCALVCRVSHLLAVHWMFANSNCSVSHLLAGATDVPPRGLKELCFS
jgi:hypothetical protein